MNAPPRRVFLDANVLFSAAWREDAGLARLWQLPAVQLLSSRYAAEEAARNLDTPAQRVRLTRLITGVELVPDAGVGELPAGIELPQKDRPILLAAIGAAATHLLTGDLRHFGPLFGTTVEGVLIQLPADFCAAPRRVAGTRPRASR